jgi:hypothetical protein
LTDFKPITLTLPGFFGLICCCLTLLVGCIPAPESNLTPDSTPLPSASPEQMPSVIPATASPEVIIIDPVPSIDPIHWQDWPVIPGQISDAMHAVYAQGLQKGNREEAFAKIGDCQSTITWFLGNFVPGGDYDLGSEYAYLQSVIDHYQDSYNRMSVATDNGFNSASILSPLWADVNQCEPEESPVTCEYRIMRPSVALIMLGTNDFYQPQTFERRLRTIIEITMDHGIVPVLSTKADNLEGDEQINQIIVRLGAEFEIPVWNFWRALQDLPNQGLEPDGGHLTDGPNYFDDPAALQTGVTIHNLTALQVLDFVWRALSSQ